MSTLGKDTIAGKAPRIEDLLDRFPPEQRSARFIFNSNEAGHFVFADFTFPAGVIVAQSQSPVRDHREAIDAVTRSLADQLRALDASFV
jgi:hypothetical protein